jgi:transposase
MQKKELRLEISYVVDRRRKFRTGKFSKVTGKPLVDDWRVISGVVYVLRNGLRWKDAPKEYGPRKTLYNRFVRWSRMGVFAKILQKLIKLKQKF